MKTLIFATTNLHKVNEIRKVTGENFNIKSLSEAHINIEIDEPYDTLEENASIKSNTIYNITGQDCFSEDTGLEVAALNNEPGVRSARYAGQENNATANVEKLLANMKGIADRSARFRTVISLIITGTEYQFEGICAGKISLKADGANGFGYDSVFVPAGSGSSFATMSLSEKIAYSHRTKATTKLLAFLSDFWKPRLF